MQPIRSMWQTTGGGGGGGAVNFDNASVSDSAFDPSDANATWQTTAGGNVLGTGISTYAWLITGVNSDYEIRATLTSGSLSSGTTGSWLLMSSTRTWTRLRTTPGTSTAIVDFECRRVSDSVVIAVWTVNFSATVEV